ncbi:MAG: FAD-dependent thymidylate synthase [Pseudomonadota bacterium]|nr:FAD-dependent thymidylate synthase [Pseudomonadota bacterium]
MHVVPIEVNYIQHCGSDLSVVNAARVSFDKESTWVPKADGWFINGMELSEKDQKLVSYLASHGHISPFHHTFITMRIKAPIFVARQLVKHKFMPWNEVSRRYVDKEPEFYFPSAWRERSVDKKQGSGGILDYTVDPRACLFALQTYLDAVRNGVAPEQARMVLPQNTMTEWYWSGTLSAWTSMLNLRLKTDTQQETREVAQKVYEIVKDLFPVSTKALVNG